MPMTCNLNTMGQHKDEGYALVALAEECAEVIQIITKAMRFGGDLDEVPPGKQSSRWAQLEAEMEDLLYQWERVKRDYGEHLIDQAEAEGS